MNLNNRPLVVTYCYLTLDDRHQVLETSLIIHALIRTAATLIVRFMGPTWGPSGADRTQVGPMLAPWTLLSGLSDTCPSVKWTIIGLDNSLLLFRHSAWEWFGEIWFNYKSSHARKWLWKCHQPNGGHMPLVSLCKSINIEITNQWDLCMSFTIALKYEKPQATTQTPV